MGIKPVLVLLVPHRLNALHDVVNHRLAERQLCSKRRTGSVPADTGIPWRACMQAHKFARTRAQSQPLHRHVIVLLHINGPARV